MSNRGDIGDCAAARTKTISYDHQFPQCREVKILFCERNQKMKKIRRYFSLLMAIAMILCMTACGGNGGSDAGSGDGTIVLKAANVASESNPYTVAMRYMADMVKERTNGAVQIDVYPNSAMGGEREILEGMQLGTVDMCVVSTAPVANFSEAWYVFDMPYLFTDLETTYEVLDGEIGAELGELLKDSGFVNLAYWQNGFFNIITKEQVIHPEDLNGMTVRCFENPIHSAYFSLCGANAVPAPWGEVYTLMQNGTIDGCTTSYTFIYNTQLDEVAGYVANTHQVYAVAPLMMSTLAWNKLTAEQQQIIMECAAEARDYERGLCNDSEAEQMAELTEKGMVLSDVDRDEWAEFMAPIKDQFVGEGKYISDELYDSIKAITSKGTF